MGLQKYRAKYTRLRIMIFVHKMLKEHQGRAFFSLLAAQVIEQFVHLDRLSEDAEVVIEETNILGNGIKLKKIEESIRSPGLNKIERIIGHFS
ncbi:MAG: hypothetical protein ACTSRK_14055 [Promethearchaeota archaeon]